MSPSSCTYGSVQIPPRNCVKPVCHNKLLSWCADQNVLEKKKPNDDSSRAASLHLFQNPSLPLMVGEVRLVGRNLTEVPPGLSSVTGLHTLDLSHNKLTTLPLTMASAPTLRELKLECNDLALHPAPPWLKLLFCCSRFSLQENPLSAGFDIISSNSRTLQRLKIVNIGNCSLSSIPNCFLNLRDLHSLCLSNREQDTATKEKNHMRASRTSYRSRLNFLTLPPVDALVGLVRLEVAGCSLSHLPSLVNLPSLALLVASSNKLTTLPDLPISLTILSVQKNNLLLLPSFSNLPKLAHVIASHNAISCIRYQKGVPMEGSD